MGCEGVKATDQFTKLVNRMSILTANKVALDVEIVEQLEDTNVDYKHRVRLPASLTVPVTVSLSFLCTDGHEQL